MSVASLRFASAGEPNLVQSVVAPSTVATPVETLAPLAGRVTKCAMHKS